MIFFFVFLFGNNHNNDEIKIEKNQIQNQNNNNNQYLENNNLIDTNNNNDNNFDNDEEDDEEDKFIFNNNIVLNPFVENNESFSFGNVAVITLVTSEKYLVAAYALATSLKIVESNVKSVILLPKKLAYNEEIQKNLTIAGFNEILEVKLVGNPAKRLKLVPNAWFKNDIFTKFRVFQLFQYERVLFLDADLVVRKNIDHIFAEHVVEPQSKFAFVPELMYLHRCNDSLWPWTNDTVLRNYQHKQHFFDDLGGVWCHGHSLKPYHGMIFSVLFLVLNYLFIIRFSFHIFLYIFFEFFFKFLNFNFLF